MGLDFMLENNVIVIPNFRYMHYSIDNVPLGLEMPLIDG